MKKIKYIVIILIIIIMIISVMLFILTKKQPINNEITYGKINKIGLMRETNNSTFILANELVNKFLTYIFEKNQYIDCKEAAYSILDDNYKNKNNITKENINNIIKEYVGYKNYITKEIYRVEITSSEDIKNLFLYIRGIVRIEGDTKNIYFLIKEDLQNSAYNIQLLTAEQFEDAKKTGIEKEEQITNIEKNSYNNLYPKTVSNYELCLMHIEDFSNAYENNIEEAYSVLDQGYKDKRFKNVNDFKELLDERKKITYFSSFSEYMVNNYSNYTEYVCKDQYGYIYIFKEEYPMQYTLQLDTYTIPTDKFKEEYEIGNEQTKVQMNINKFILMINNQDYNAAYKVLAESFKNNYFPTKELFIKYMQQKFYRYNDLKISSLDKKGNTYICKTLLSDFTNGVYKDSTKATINQVEFNVVMQLGEGYDFVMSFEVE